MKVVYIVFSLVTVLFLLSCDQKTQEQPKVIETVDDKIDDEIIGVDPIMIHCNNLGTVTIDKTTTLSASDLWSNAESCDNLIIENKLIKMDDITKNGTLITSDFHIDNFSELVPSWNVLIDKNSAVTFMFSVGNENGYSDFFTMGYWKENYKASFKSQSDEYAKVSIDTIITKIDSIDRIKIKVIFKKTTTDNTMLKNISITTKGINSVNTFNFDVLEDKFIDVAPRQQLSIPTIGSSICSPTSLSMLMNFYGFSDTQDVVAGKVFDKGENIYGNWTFNASYAGGFDGLYSRVEYINDLSQIMDYLNQDIPMAFSIKTNSKDELVGSLMGYSSGHLVVLVGVKEIDGTWYGIVNDPAEYTDENVQREYKLSELLAVWRGYAYVVSNEALQ